jgi:exosortase/archaeosortase family protein
VTDSSAQAIPFSGSPARRRGWLWPAAAVGVGLAFVVFNGLVRNVEALITSHIVGWISHMDTWVVYSNHAVYWFGDSNAAAPGGVVVTGECSSALLIAGLLGVGAIVMRSPRFPQKRVAAALAVSAAVLFVLNLARILLIGWATSRWGYNGYDWAHTIVGSLLVVITVVTAVAVFVGILIHQSKRDHQSKRARTF